MAKLWADRMTKQERDQSFPDSEPRDAATLMLIDRSGAGAQGAARPPPRRPQIHARQVRLPRRAHRGARPRHAGGERTASRHREEAQRARGAAGRGLRPRPRARRRARDRGRNRPAAGREGQRAAADAGRDLDRIRQGAASIPISAISISSPAPSPRRAGRAATTPASSPPTPPRSPTPSRAWWGRIPSWSSSPGCRSNRPPSSTCRPSPAWCWRNCWPASRPAWRTALPVPFYFMQDQQFHRELL